MRWADILVVRVMEHGSVANAVPAFIVFTELSPNERILSNLRMIMRGWRQASSIRVPLIEGVCGRGNYDPLTTF